MDHLWDVVSKLARGWMGTGVSSNDVLASCATPVPSPLARVHRTFLLYWPITVTALFLVFGRYCWCPCANAALRMPAQERAHPYGYLMPKRKKRGLWRGELHSTGSGQIFVGVRYALDQSRRRLERGDTCAQSLWQGESTRPYAEVHRRSSGVSAVLRPAFP